MQEGIEPYTLLRIEKKHRSTFRFDRKADTFVFDPDCGLWVFYAHYYAVRRTPYVLVEAKDELDAFIQATQEIAKRKAAYERRNAKKGASK